MKEYKLEEVASKKVTNANNLPAKVSTWSKIKNFVLYEMDFNKPIVLEFTPKEEKVLTEIHDFLFQEIKFPELHDFFFQDINIFSRKKKVKEDAASVVVNPVVEKEQDMPSGNSNVFAEFKTDDVNNFKENL